MFFDYISVTEMMHVNNTNEKGTEKLNTLWFGRVACMCSVDILMTKIRSNVLNILHYACVRVIWKQLRDLEICLWIRFNSWSLFKSSSNDLLFYIVVIDVPYALLSTLSLCWNSIIEWNIVLSHFVRSFVRSLKCTAAFTWNQCTKKKRKKLINNFQSQFRTHS